jgi:hypothetical protein
MDKKRAFTDTIKLRPAQKEYLRSIQGEYSLAGKLDQIINFYKDEHSEAPKT